MAEDNAHPCATTLESDLDMDMDMNVDPDLEVLMVAAAKAQEAAIEYQTQTASLCGTRSFSPHPHTKDREICSRPPEMQHSKRIALAEDSKPEKERDNNEEGSGSRADTSYSSSNMIQKHCSSPGDSALGESLSDAEELVHQPGVITQPSIVDATTPVVETTSNKEPQLMSESRSSEPLPPLGVNTGRPEVASPKLKRPRQPKPPRLPENAANSPALEYSFRRPQPMSAQNVRQSKNDRIQSGSNIRHHGSESSSQRVRSFSRSEDLAFVQVFKTVVYANVNATAHRYKSRLSRDELIRIGKLVSLPDLIFFKLLNEFSRFNPNSRLQMK